jgi:gamma-glutamyltranspeptidase / glutathione hydrolase
MRFNQRISSTMVDMRGRSTVYAPNGAIATSQPVASAAGLHVLQSGGNAIDAAVTAAAVLTVVEPHMVSLGGDLFALIWVAHEQALHGLNASGRSGSLMTREELAARGRTAVPSDGAESITVPGALSGWTTLLEWYGTRSLAEALAPAIRIAEDGFPVTPIIARDWSAHAQSLLHDEGAAATFLIDEDTPRAGEWFRNPDYAQTLRDVARYGPPHLYGGPLGRRIADYVRARDGFLTLEDFAAHQATWVEPISVPFRGHRLWELPPNGQGIAALEMLRILDGYDLAALGHNSAAYLHHLIEAKKLAFADLERYIGDPAHMQVRVDELLDDDAIRARRAQLSRQHAGEHAQPMDFVTAGDTVYVSVCDAFGNMVSLISSVFGDFGSGVVVPGTGFALQNRGAGLTMTPERANTVAPRRLPLHTIHTRFRHAQRCRP